MKEWYTMQELAEMFSVGYSKVRNAVATLIKLGQIQTRDNPADNRVLEIHRDSIETVRKAVLG